VAALGRQLDVLPLEATHVMVAASLISITLNPLLYKLTKPTARWLLRYVGRNNVDDAQPASEAEDSSHRAVVVGYGPVGKLVWLRRARLDRARDRVRQELVESGAS